MKSNSIVGVSNHVYNTSSAYRGTRCKVPVNVKVKFQPFLNRLQEVGGSRLGRQAEAGVFPRQTEPAVLGAASRIEGAQLPALHGTVEFLTQKFAEGGQSHFRQRQEHRHRTDAGDLCTTGSAGQTKLEIGSFGGSRPVLFCRD